MDWSLKLGFEINADMRFSTDITQYDVLKSSFNDVVRDFGRIDNL